MTYLFDVNYDGKHSGSHHFTVKQKYLVRINKDEASCGCDDFIYKGSKNKKGNCKHIKECLRRAKLYDEFEKELLK